MRKIAVFIRENRGLAALLGFGLAVGLFGAAMEVAPMLGNLLFQVLNP